jgi:hypothetical protein
MNFLIQIAIEGSVISRHAMSSHSTRVLSTNLLNSRSIPYKQLNQSCFLKLIRGILYKPRDPKAYV